MSKPIDRQRLLHFAGPEPAGPKLADIHMHTTHSDGWWSPELLAETAVARGLDAIAITDHDEVRGGFVVADYVARRILPLEVVTGAEISTRDRGRDVHIIGLGLNDNIRPWQSIEATIKDILAQGGIPVIPHFKADPARSPHADQVLALAAPVAIEVYNAMTSDMGRFARKRGEDNYAARAFAEQFEDQLLGVVGGTDGHFRTVGRGLTAYDGDLLKSIREKRTAALFESQRERLMPWDLLGYRNGLKSMAVRRRGRWGPDRPNG